MSTEDKTKNLRASATDAIDRVRKAHAEVNKAIDEKKDAAEEVRRKILDLAQNGTRPAAEALDEFRADLNGRAERGRHALERYARSLSRPRHPVEGMKMSRPNRPTLAGVMETMLNANGTLTTNGDVLAFLLEPQLDELISGLIDEQCANPTVPDADQRPAEIKKLLAERERLMSELDDLLDERARLFGGKPSERTLAAQESAQRRELLEALNAPGRKAEGRWSDYDG